MKNIDLSEKLRIIESLDYLPTKGKIFMFHVKVVFFYLIFHLKWMQREGKVSGKIRKGVCFKA